MIAGFKKFMSCIDLNCIASFISGAYSILLINYFWFDSDITPAGVSSLIAAMALAFTVYVAFKVKEWNLIKTNDRGFRQTEDILSNLIELYKTVNSITPQIVGIMNTVDEREIVLYHSNISKLNKEIKKITNEFDGLSVSLELWSVTFDKRLEDNVIQIFEQLTYFNYKIDPIIGDVYYSGTLTYECLKHLDSCKGHFIEIFKLKHKDMFVFN